MFLTKGQASEHTKAQTLIKGFNATYIIADKDYDSNAFITTMQNNHAIRVIPT